MNKRVCVVGLGYIGLPTVALLASKGCIVVHGVDVIKNVVDTINQGKIHIVEPELDKFVKEAVESGNLKADTKPAKIYEYLACGLKVVSVEWEQIKDMNDIINLTTKKDEFVYAIEHGNSLEYDLLKLTWFEILGKFLKDMDV